MSIADEYNKLLVVFLDDARLVVGFAGLAAWERWDTSTWLRQAIGSARHVHSDISYVLNALRVQLDAALSQLTAPDRRLTVMFCGFTYWPQPEAKVYLLTNWEHGASGQFIQIAQPLQEGALVVLAGDSKAFAAGATERLRQLALRIDLGPTELLRFAVAHLRRAAAGSVLIGEQCNSAVTPAQPNSMITHTYHSGFKSHVAYGCDVIMPTMEVTGIRLLDTRAAIAGPDIKPKSLCWCDSGAQFRKCHMKHYGAFPPGAGFTRPLPWVVEETRATSAAAGARCIVSSAYT